MASRTSAVFLGHGRARGGTRSCCLEESFARQSLPDSERVNRRASTDPDAAVRVQTDGTRTSATVACPLSILREERQRPPREVKNQPSRDAPSAVCTQLWPPLCDAPPLLPVLMQQHAARNEQCQREYYDGETRVFLEGTAQERA
ncbi:hypothetical protein MTO96_020594 [Rhipicephalus appendiculatus]